MSKQPVGQKENQNGYFKTHWAENIKTCHSTRRMLPHPGRKSRALNVRMGRDQRPSIQHACKARENNEADMENHSNKEGKQARQKVKRGSLKNITNLIASHARLKGKDGPNCQRQG